MSTFFVASGVLFWASLGAGGLWVGLCWFADRRQQRLDAPRWAALDARQRRLDRRTAQLTAVENRRAQEAEARDV